MKKAIVLLVSSLMFVAMLAPVADAITQTKVYRPYGNSNPKYWYAETTGWNVYRARKAKQVSKSRILRSGTDGYWRISNVYAYIYLYAWFNGRWNLQSSGIKKNYIGSRFPSGPYGATAYATSYALGYTHLANGRSYFKTGSKAVNLYTSVKWR